MSIFEDIIGRTLFLEKEAIIGNQNLTYSELIKLSEKLTTFLKLLGIGKGSIVGICLSNSAEYVIAILAVYQLGGICVLLNPESTSYENQYIRSNSCMSFLITNNDFNTVEDMYEELKKHSWNGLQIIGPNLQSNHDYEIVHGDCMIIYTSGSTARPKGVVLTDNSISNNIRAVSHYLNLTSQDKTIVFTPPAYTYAISQVFTHLWVGGSILPYSHGLRFPYEINRYISDYNFTGLAANPTSYRLLTSIKLKSSFSFDSVRYVMSGGQPLDSYLVNNLSKRFRTAQIVNMYGCTENSPRISYCWLPKNIPPHSSKPWPVGHAIEGTQIRIINDAGIELTQGEIGQIQISGTSLMRSYWREPRLTNERLIEGWFKTGDLGYIDSTGALNLTGRIDNIINVGHEKVSPEEIEEVIRATDLVRDVGVTAVDDNLLGNRTVALVVLKEDKDILENLKIECKKNLSTHKVPKKFIKVKELPKTLYGKINRQKLKELIDISDNS